MGSLEQPHRRERAEQPGEFADLGHIALAVEDALFRIESAGEQVERDVECVLSALLGVGQRRHRVIVRDEIESVTAGLQFDGWPHHAKIIADVERAGRLDARKYAHGRKKKLVATRNEMNGGSHVSDGGGRHIAAHNDGRRH